MSNSIRIEVNKPLIVSRNNIRVLVKRKQAEREEQFQSLTNQYILGQEEIQITNLSWNQLLNHLQTRQLSASSVLRAFIAKALHISPNCNPITEFIPQAHEWARKLDSLPEVKGPLHGIPFCVKDDTNVQGMDSTIGFGKNLYQPAFESANLIKVLQDLGAIPFCKTNVPQGLCGISGNNPVYGMTSNAHNQHLTPGGSSSGTGALVGSGGIHFGTGTDIGGSLRIPAHFNGCVSLKPTAFRLSCKGIRPPAEPMVVGLEASPGIMGMSVQTVVDVYQAMFNSGKHSELDPMVPPIPWNSAEFESTRKLKVGYYTSIPYFPAIGDTVETVLRAKEQLEALGHTLIPIQIPDGYYYMKVFTDLLFADFRNFSELWKGEEIVEDTKLVYASTITPIWIQKMVGRLISCSWVPSSIHSKRLGHVMGGGARKSYEIWDTVEERNQIRQKLLTEWKELDGVVCPVFPFPAPRKEVMGKLLGGMCYTVFWNLVEFPAGVIPFGSETGKNVDAYNDEGDFGLRAVKNVLKESIGAPIGIQIVGKPYREETVLRIMKELEPFSTFRRN